MSHQLCTIQDLTSSDTFEANPPPNLYGVRAGDRVSVRTPRKVVRVGYRKRGRDYSEEAVEVIRGIQASFMEHARTALGQQPPRGHSQLPGRANLALHSGVCNALMYLDGFGGPERGMWLREFSLPKNLPPAGEVVQVRSTVVGTYFPPSGSSGFNSWTGDWDSPDPGGLDKQRTVTIAQVRIGLYTYDIPTGYLRHLSRNCPACDPEGWQCERGPHRPGTLHAIGLAHGEEPTFDEEGALLNASRAWKGHTRWRETSNRVLDYLMDQNHGATDAEAAEALGLSVGTVRKHRKILVEEDLIGE